MFPVNWQKLLEESILATEGEWNNIKQIKNKMSVDGSKNKYIRYVKKKCLNSIKRKRLSSHNFTTPYVIYKLKDNGTEKLKIKLCTNRQSNLSHNSLIGKMDC